LNRVNFTPRQLQIIDEYKKGKSADEIGTKGEISLLDSMLFQPPFYGFSF